MRKCSVEPLVGAVKFGGRNQFTELIHHSEHEISETCAFKTVWYVYFMYFMYWTAQGNRAAAQRMYVDILQGMNLC